MVFLSPSRDRSSGREFRPNQDGHSFRLIQLCFFLAFFLVLQDARCFAFTNDTSKDEGATNIATSAIDARDTAAGDAARLASPAYDSGAAAGQDAPALTFDHSALPVDDLFSGTLNPDKDTIRAAQLPECTLFWETLCRVAKNKPLLALTAAQTAALVSDGVTTRLFLRRGYVEVDPLARILIGRKPTWARMAPLGAVQVVAGMWLAEQMASSQHPWVRRLWWLPQVIGIAANAASSAHNATLR